MVHIAALLLSSLYLVFLYLLINFACLASTILKLSTPYLLVVNHVLAFQLNVHNMLNTFILSPITSYIFRISMFHNAFFNSIIDKTPTHALFIQHYISLAC